ncbi:hypothetical protein EI94DRAFT_1801169 [Lactarius quietus]|nr:hypothetical protein EI94DRAFT_1801169 [Lactarius quietus]
MSDTIMPDNNAVQTLLHKDDALLLYKAELLYERNELLWECISLGGAPIEYSEVDFLSPPEPTHPYMIFPHGIAEICVSRPACARYPTNCHQFTKGTQTEDTNADTDVMLMDIDPTAIPRDSKEEENK